MEDHQEHRHQDVDRHLHQEHHQDEDQNHQGEDHRHRRDEDRQDQDVNRDLDVIQGQDVNRDQDVSQDQDGNLRDEHHQGARVHQVEAEWACQTRTWGQVEAECEDHLDEEAYQEATEPVLRGAQVETLEAD